MANTKTSKSVKKTVKKPKAVGSKKVVATKKARVRKNAEYKSFRLAKRIKHPKGAPEKTLKLIESAWRLMMGVKKQIFILVAIFTLLNVLFVQALSAPVEFNEFRQSVQEFFAEDGGGGVVETNTAFLAFLFGSTGQTVTEATSLYQTFFILIFSLAFIWLYRQHSAGNKITARMALYRGMYPLVPMILVFIVIGLQLLPLVIGSGIFSIVTASGIAVNFYEQALWLFVLFLLGLLSLYMISSSIFALYIVTLAEMTPMRALRSARQLVMHRRFAVIRRLVVFVIFLFIAVAGIMLPILLFLPALAGWIYFALTMFLLPVTHAYMYSFYKSLL